MRRTGEPCEPPPSTQCEEHRRPNNPLLRWKKRVEHQKQTQTQQAGIIEKEGKIHISNVAILEPSQSKKSKIGFKFLKDGKKVRFYKSNSEVIDDK